MQKFLIQRSLRRGRTANRLAMMLFFVLVSVLVVSVYHGLSSLPNGS